MMVTDRRVVIIIDHLTREVVKSANYTSISNNAIVLADAKEIGDEHRGSVLVVFSTYLHVGITVDNILSVCSQYSIELFIVYSDPKDIIGFEGVPNKVRCNFTDSLDWNLVYAVVHKDSAILESYTGVTQMVSAFDSLRNVIPIEWADKLENVYSGYLSLLAKESDLVGEITIMRETLQANTNINKRMLNGIKGLKATLDMYKDKIKEYETLLSGMIDISIVGHYPDRPKVLYVKQISHIAGMDVLLNLLHFVLTAQYKYSCKVVKLLDASCALRTVNIPNSYTFVNDVYKTDVILKNQFLCKMGPPRVLFDTLLLNRSSLNYLIVHDMRGVSGRVLDKPLYDVALNEMTADYALLGSDALIISDNNKVADFGWLFKDYLKNNSTDIQRMTGHPTVEGILDLLM